MVTPGQCLKDSATLSLSLVIDRSQTHDELTVLATDVGHRLAAVPCLGTVNTALLGHDGDHHYRTATQTVVLRSYWQERAC